MVTTSTHRNGWDHKTVGILHVDLLLAAVMFARVSRAVAPRSLVDDDGPDELHGF